MKGKTKIEILGGNVLEKVKQIFPNRTPENVIEVEKENTGWKVLVEVLERKAVPDSQDLIGIYEVILGARGEILGYKRTKVRHRTDTES